MPIELVAALHAWWRYTWRTSLAILGGVALGVPAIVAVIAATTATARNGDHSMAPVIGAIGISAILAIVVVGFSFWIMGQIMRRSVYRRPFLVRGRSYNCVIREDGVFLTNPLPSNVAWALIWGQYWRATLLSLPLSFISFGFSPSWTSAPPTDPLAFLRMILPWELLLGLSGLVVGVLSFWWLIHRSYGRNSICVVPSTALRGIDLLPAPIKDGNAY